MSLCCAGKRFYWSLFKLFTSHFIYFSLIRFKLKTNVKPNILNNGKARS